MEPSFLSRRDINVLEKIKDPESNPATAVLVDPSLPKDPNVRDPAVYARVSQKEREIVLAMQQLELEQAESRPRRAIDPTEEFRECVSDLERLIDEQPNYASARNNRVQALRRLYGDGMLVEEKSAPSQGFLHRIGRDERTRAAATTLADLEKAISLLTPASPFSALSPTTAKTLSLAHTQRAAIYHATSKLLERGAVDVGPDRKESSWTALEFEGAASRDFAMGARYGNEIAKGLAVSTNPTAKLCGQMVREMMRKEYGPGLDY